MKYQKEKLLVDKKGTRANMLSTKMNLAVKKYDKMDRLSIKK